MRRSLGCKGAGRDINDHRQVQKDRRDIFHGLSGEIAHRGQHAFMRGRMRAGFSLDGRQWPGALARRAIREQRQRVLDRGGQHAKADAAWRVLADAEINRSRQHEKHQGRNEP